MLPWWHGPWNFQEASKASDPSSPKLRASWADVTALLGFRSKSALFVLVCDCLQVVLSYWWGVDSVVACLCEFVAFFFVDHGIRWLGHMGIMYIGLIGYGVRFAVYASITNPWVVLPADALQGEQLVTNNWFKFWVVLLSCISGSLGNQVRSRTKVSHQESSITWWKEPKLQSSVYSFLCLTILLTLVCLI